MGLIFAKLWSLFSNQGEQDGAAGRLGPGEKGLAAEGDRQLEAGLPVGADVLRRTEVTSSRGRVERQNFRPGEGAGEMGGRSGGSAEEASGVPGSGRSMLGF